MGAWFRERRERVVRAACDATDDSSTGGVSRLVLRRRRNSGAIAGNYVGKERRARTPIVPPNPREFALAGVLIVVLAVLFALTAGARPWSGTARWTSLNAALGSMAALLAAIVGALGVMRWRITGEAAALRVGTSVLFIGVATAAPVVGLIFPELDPETVPLALGPAAALAASIGLVAA